MKQPESLWLAQKPESHYGSLDQNLTVDVVVVGGGISGLTAALLLQKSGKKVALLDHTTLATGDSGETTAHLTDIIDTRYDTLISDFGKKKASQVAESSRASIRQIESFIREYQIDCDFKRVPAYLYAEKKEQVPELKKELKAIQEVCKNAVWCDEVPVGFPNCGGIRLEDEAQFHASKYLGALGKAFTALGGLVFENTQALDIKDGWVKTERGEVTAKSVFVATHSPSSHKVLLHTKLFAYRTYAIAVKLNNPPPIGLYWDSDDPYHYIRNQKDFWVIGGEDHKTGHKEDTVECFQNLIAYAKKRYDVKEVVYQWSGQVIESVDGLPYMGRSPFSKNLYVATGFMGNGMTFGTLSGMIVNDLICERTSPWEELYRPSRVKPISSALDYISENVDFPLCFIKDRVAPSEVSSVDEIKIGEGKKIKKGHQIVAVYRDEQDQIHSVSAVCGHMGCIVRWNTAEKSWDCPCHGARFTPQGKLLNGPAKQDLTPVKL